MAAMSASLAPGSTRSAAGSPVTRTKKKIVSDKRNSESSEYPTRLPIYCFMMLSALDRARRPPRKPTAACSNAALPSPTKPFGLGPPSPAMRERGFELDAAQSLSRIVGKGSAPSKAGEDHAIPHFTPMLANLPYRE